MKFKLTVDAQKGVHKGIDVQKEAEELDKAIEEELLKHMPEDTAAAISPELSAFGKRALKARQKIVYLQKVISSLLKRGQDSAEKQLLLQKQYSLLTLAMKEGYYVVMKLREFVTKEKMGYAIRISSGAEETLGIYSIDEMLAMTTLVDKGEGHFALAFKNVEEIEKAANNQNELSKRFANELNSVLKAYKIIRKNVISKRSARRKEQLADENFKGNLISVYYPGMGGFLLERAFISVAKKEQAETVFDFVSDTDRYSSGGDLQGTEVLFTLKDTYDNLEVKNVTEMGASLVDIRTLIRDLDKIIEICFKSRAKTLEAFNKKLKKEIFKNTGKVSSVRKSFANILDAANDEIVKALTSI